jgi:S-methylmethionine-dependent homocysteine/selenocysteine methylase
MPDDKDSILKIFKGIQSDPKKIFLMDGGTGEELFARGVPTTEKYGLRLPL